MADNHLLSSEDLTTIGGAITIVVTVSNALLYALGWSPRYVALAASFAVAAVGVASGDPGSWKAWCLGFFNAFVIYCGAVGVSTMATAAGGQAPRRNGRAVRAGAPEEVGLPVRRFWLPWF